MRLKIKNFQSIEDCDIEIPEKSFTCLVGPTNIGKSAVRRALECVLYNKSEISYIRNGSTQCEVHLTLEDGTDIKWFRDKKTAFYEVNGESFSKLAGSVPDILTNKGFRELHLSKDKIAVQVAHQFENIFLLNQSGSKITEVLSSLGNLHKIIEANKSCLSDKKNVRSVLKVRNEDLILEKQKSLSFKGLDDQKIKIQSLKDIFSEVKGVETKVSSGKKLLSKLEKLMVTVSQLRKISSVDCPVYDLDLDQFNSLKNFNNRLIKTENKVTKYQTLKNIELVSFDLDNSKDLFFKIKNIQKKLESSTKKIKNLENIPQEVSGISIDMSGVYEVKKILNKLNISKNNLLKIRSDLSNHEQSLESLEKEFLIIKKELKVCPLCDSNLV
jgi:DNA repair ATPase RecN